MAERIESDRVLDRDSVGSVYRTTRSERFLDALPSSIQGITAALGITGAVVISVCILFSENVALKEYKSGAWAVISAFAGACSTYLFGDSRKT